MDPLISAPDHPRWTDPQFLALAQHKQEAAMQENDCPGHVASANNPKICARCGVHIDSLRPPEESVMPPFDKSTIPDGYMLVPIVLPPGIVTQATPAVELRDKPGNMVERCWRLLLSALQAKGY